MKIGGKQRRNQEQHAGDQCGQAGAAADSHAGGGLDKGRGGRGAEDSARRGRNRVGQQRGLDARQLAVLVEHFCLGGNADQACRGRVKNIDEQERENDND